MTKQNALVGAQRLAEENATTLEQNVKAGVASQLQFRLAQNDLLDVKTGLLSVAYKQHIDLAEWDRTMGKYLRFLDETAIRAIVAAVEITEKIALGCRAAHRSCCCRLVFTVAGG